ncbi:MAG TPA: leucyl aminopeptidase [Blastocatellia bacterium]|nr:leucyl aminopeptidase [Blastocatellia bacterium]
MEITSSRKGLSEVEEDVIAVPVFEGENPREGTLAALDHLTRGAVAPLFEAGEVDGKKDRWAMLYNTGTLQARRLLLYGAGKVEAATTVDLQRFAGAVVRLLSQRRIKTAAFFLSDRLDAATSARAYAEGAIIGQMNGDLYASKEEPTREIERIALMSETPVSADFDSAIRIGVEMGEATNLARALAFEPGNVITPSELARRAEEVAGREGLAVEILDENGLKHLGCGALLAVSRGSAEPPRMIVLSYEPDGPPQGELPALIGKGITFDSGGISIKPALNMEEMKYDMGGGAAVIGAMQVIARLRPRSRVLGLIPAAENMPSGRATKPGDVVRSLSGKTIEVVNTDAEGRLILADAMTYAINRGATCLIDAATLTGACVVALGDVRAAVMGTDQKLIDDLIADGEQCGERLWQLPVDAEYADYIKSDIADLKNVGNRVAGAITAGMFLKSFAGSTPWAHLDIAGTAWLEQVKPYMAKGATGFGVKVMANYILNLESRSQNPEVRRV